MPTTRCVCARHTEARCWNLPRTPRPGTRATPPSGPASPPRGQTHLGVSARVTRGLPGHSHDKPERQGQQGRPRFSSGQLCQARVLDTRVERTFLCGDGERDSRVPFPKASCASQSRRHFRGPSRASSGSQLPSPETRLFPPSCKTGSLGVMSRN